jgi:hypothetical protein
VRWYICKCRPPSVAGPTLKGPECAYPRLSTLRVQTEYYGYVECLCCICDERRTGSRRQRSRMYDVQWGLSATSLRIITARSIAYAKNNRAACISLNTISRRFRAKRRRSAG